MKLFQQLLVAPAALGLLAPVAATAAELNINDVSSYSSSSRPSKAAKKRVQGISQFSSIYPNDWAHQALSSMLERHGCPPVSSKGALSRFEAAALLNKCIRNVAHANQEERRLINEFSQELAVVNGRIDGIEAGIAMSEVDFSTTTKMSGVSIWTIGAINQEETGTGTAAREGLAFNHKYELELETSFSGDDLMVTSVEAGNFVDADPFGGSGTAALESAMSSSNKLTIGKSFYQRPVGEDFTITVGAIVRQDDMLAVWPSDYPSDTILDSMTYAGAPAAYNLAEGAGAGVTYSKGNWAASLTYVGEAEGDDTSGTAANSGSATDGVLTREGDDNITAQVAWSNDRWLVAAALTTADGGYPGGDEALKADADAYTAFGLSGVYQIDGGKTLPSSISAGFGKKYPDHKTDSGATRSTYVQEETSWTVGLLWEDSFFEGNTLGYAIGSAEGWKDTNGYENPISMELFYSMPVSDNITVTPAIFAIEVDEGKDVNGALVKTTFTF